MKTYNATKLAQELIRFPTIKTEDKGIMKFLSKKLSSIGFKCKIIRSSGSGSKPALNLYARYGKLKPHIMYLGHTDVVTNLDNWKLPPFKAVVSKGYLNGRGAQDMKGGIACWISATSNFIRYNKFKDIIEKAIPQLKDIEYDIKKSHITKTIPGGGISWHKDYKRSKALLIPIGENKGSIYYENFTYKYEGPTFIITNVLHKTHNDSNINRYTIQLHINS